MDLGTSGRQLCNQRYLNLAMGGRGSPQVLAHLALAFPPACPQPDIAALDAKSWFHPTRTCGLNSLSTTRPVTEICWGLLVPLQAVAQQQVRSSKRCGKQHSEHQPSSELRGMLWGSRVPFHPRQMGSPSAGKNAFPVHFLFSPKITGYWGIAR